MMILKAENIPAALSSRRQWVTWKTSVRSGQPTKLPFQINGQLAKSNDRETWNTFLAVTLATGYDGIGFVFADDDPFAGIDLDGCRDPKSGKVADWAKEIILEFSTYAEVSPSETGVKLFCIGKLPFDTGRKVEVTEERIVDKAPAIEVYDHLRYFAMTGWRLANQPHEPEDRQEKLDALCSKYFADPIKLTTSKTFYQPASVMDRAKKYLDTLEPAISGSGGHNRAFHAACVLVCGFSLSRDEALELMAQWNQICQPPWSQRELEHKVDQALKQPGDRGYLRNAQPHTWRHINVPKYEQKEPPKTVDLVTLGDAARQYIGRVKSGGTTLIDTGLPDLDGAIGGGVENGEMVILAARPSHGKSLVALQCTHNWTAMDMPVLFVTEEMSPIALGKRMLQYASTLPTEHWNHQTDKLERDLEGYEEKRSLCHIAANCGTTAAMHEQIEQAVEKHGIKVVVVDYAQLLSSPGHSRYDQITFTSETLRKIANTHHLLVLVLCQMNRSIEGRKRFEPCMSDIKETGQFEQDADVILFLVWPHRIDDKADPREFRFYVAKNRNRAINQSVVSCRIMPSRQMLVHTSYRESSTGEEFLPYKDVQHDFGEYNA